MDTFTLKNDWDEIQSSRNKRRTRLFLILSVFVLIFGLRGLDIITFEIYKGYIESKGNNITNNIFKRYANGTIGRHSSSASQEGSNQEIFNRKIGFSLSSQSPDSENLQQEHRANNNLFLEKIIKDELLKEKRLKDRFEYSYISAEKYEISDRYWFPLMKKGNTFYRVIIRSQENIDYYEVYEVTFSGEIDFDIYGACTIGELKKVISEKIALQVVESIKKDFENK